MPGISPVQQLLLELDTLRLPVAKADAGGFSAVVEIVFQTPSGAFKQVRNIEELMGRPRFKGDLHAVVATSDGERLVQHDKRMLAMNREVMATVGSPDVVGVVRVVSHIIPATFLLTLRHLGVKYSDECVDEVALICATNPAFSGVRCNNTGIVEGYLLMRPQYKVR